VKLTAVVEKDSCEIESQPTVTEGVTDRSDGDVRLTDAKNVLDSQPTVIDGMTGQPDRDVRLTDSHKVTVKQPVGEDRSVIDHENDIPEPSRVVRPSGRIPPGLRKQEELKEIKLKPRIPRKRKQVKPIMEVKRRGRPRKRLKPNLNDFGRPIIDSSGVEPKTQPPDESGAAGIRWTRSGRRVRPPNRD
jgi:hypothetical protein